MKLIEKGINCFSILQAPNGNKKSESRQIELIEKQKRLDDISNNS